ncbi:ctenidin-3-like [Cucumis melo var. makuwa]|uniref:Ctenidin-3-like n=1 Tax=Cucumis melo var. makuwa TaxID=1194695 RepID=A0A5D3CRS6_CUCMM|nr:ctenidin-3-like [Cucumis melo var. makuwa]
MNFFIPVFPFLIAILLLSPSLSLATSRKDGGFGGMFGPGNGFDDIPGFGKGWDKGIVGGGYGGGYGGPKGGYGKGGIIRKPVVCKEKGPCFNKKVTCPAKCFSSYSRSGKGYGGGGGGGGCTIDCAKKCIGYC